MKLDVSMSQSFLIMVLLFSCAATLFAYADYGVDPNGGPFFDNYKQLFTFIAKLEGLSADPDTIRKLASAIFRLSFLLAILYNFFCMATPFKKYNCLSGSILHKIRPE